MGARPEGFREAATCPDLGAGIPVGQEGGAGSPGPGVAGQPLCEVDFSAVLESPMSTGEMGVTGFPHRRAPLNHTARRSDSRGLGTAGVPRPDTGAQSPEAGCLGLLPCPLFLQPSSPPWGPWRQSGGSGSCPGLALWQAPGVTLGKALGGHGSHVHSDGAAACSQPSKPPRRPALTGVQLV